MDGLLDQLESHITALVARIAKLETLEDQPAAFAELDKQFIAQYALLQQQYTAARQIEEQKRVSQQHDADINNVLIELAECRKQLETRMGDQRPQPLGVESETLLDYASRITRFTRQMPGTVDPTVLPWPAEDQLRRGMLAILTIQDENSAQAGDEGAGAGLPGADVSVDAMQVDVPVEHAKPAKQANTRSTGPPRAPPAPKKKINLDFDSDDD